MPLFERSGEHLSRDLRHGLDSSLVHRAVFSRRRRQVLPRHEPLRASLVARLESPHALCLSRRPLHHDRPDQTRRKKGLLSRVAGARFQAQAPEEPGVRLSPHRARSGPKPLLLSEDRADRNESALLATTRRPTAFAGGCSRYQYSAPLLSLLLGWTVFTR